MVLPIALYERRKAFVHVMLFPAKQFVRNVAAMAEALKPSRSTTMPHFRMLVLGVGFGSQQRPAVCIRKETAVFPYKTGSDGKF